MKDRVAKPLLDIHCEYEPYCEYPSAIRVAMDDGTIQTYALLNKTEYMFGRVMESLKNMRVGYPRTKNRRNR